MVLTLLGYLLLVLTGLAVCLFCWLGYACMTRAAPPTERLAEHSLVEQAAPDMAPSIGAGRR